jgi:dolichyl-phosphate-mannose-protein mannosyltransferase
VDSKAETAARRTAPTSLPDRGDLAIALAFAAASLVLFLWRIGDPAKLDFDETHYVPAARSLLDFAMLPNPEHPPLGKLLIALGIALFGDGPFGWRAMSALAGAVLVASGVMAARWLFLRRPAAVMTGILLLLSQTLFIQARIAMLDIFMASFLTVAFWMLAGFTRTVFYINWRPIVAGLAIGLAVAAKWTAVPLAAAAVAVVLVLFWQSKQSVKHEHLRAMAILAGWLGPFALLVYLATFLPYLFLRTGALSLFDILPQQLEMLRLQSQPLTPHPYSSRWWQWLLDLRPIWYFYEPVDGVQRGVLMLGNPAIMWGGLAALPACLWAGLRQGARPLLVPVLLYVAALLFFAAIPKGVQFYYHYFMPSLLLCAALAGLLDHWFWRRGNQLVPWLAIGFAGLVFLEFYPIISAAPLGDPQDFNRWMWLESWR